MTSLGLTYATWETWRAERELARARRILAVARLVLRQDPTRAIEIYAVWCVFAWAMCLARGVMFEISGSALSGLTGLGGFAGASIATVVAIVPIVGAWVESSRAQAVGWLLCALFHGGLAGLLASESVWLPGVWAYGGLALLSLLPIWRQTLDG